MAHYYLPLFATCTPHHTPCLRSHAGAPMPKATVRKNGQKVALALDQTPEFCKIKLKAVKRGDGGDYELELANEMGADKVPITIKVVGECGGLSLVVRVDTDHNP